MNYPGGGRREFPVQYLLWLSAATSLLGLALIIGYVSTAGGPFLLETGVIPFVLGRTWDPTAGRFGILPMIVGSGAVTFWTLALGMPLGVGAAIFLAEFAPLRLAECLRPLLALLAGIPSVIYGFYGLVVVVPFLRQTFGGPGFSILAGSVILAIMILPTVTNIAEDSLRAVPREYREASLALGATRWQTVCRVVLPAARPGIAAAAVLAMGRAVGETMAVIMVTGNVPAIPRSLLDPVRTLTGNIALEMSYAAGAHQQALFATGLVLLLFALLLNLAVGLITKGGRTS